MAMDLALLIQGVGSIGVFSARAFLPAFATALLLRFGPQVPGVAESGLLPHVRDVPTWFTRDTTLVVLGLLAALELAATRIPEARDLLDAVHDYLKVGMAVLTYLGVVGASDRDLVAQTIRPAGLVGQLPALAVGVGVYFASRARGVVVGTLSDADQDDDLGLQGLVRWVEDLWGGLGPVALILLPLLTVAMLAIAAALLALIVRRVEARAEATQVACSTCGRLIHAGAMSCPHCRAEVPAPRAVGLLGQAKARPADPASHPYRLVAVKRCPVCATRLDRRAVLQECGACGHRLMDDPDFARAYIAHVDRRVPLACAICFLLGLVPVLGVIPGVIYYRLAIVAPFRRYIPPGRNFLLRWGIRLVTLILVAFQWVPLLGGFLVPLMALVNYGAYRTAFRKLALAQ
jgi:Double zinc ribbon